MINSSNFIKLRVNGHPAQVFFPDTTYEII